MVSASNPNERNLIRFDSKENPALPIIEPIEDRLWIDCGAYCGGRITAAKGDVLYCGLVHANALELGRKTPFFIVLGNASRVELRYNGKRAAFSLRTRDNAAKTGVGQ